MKNFIDILGVHVSPVNPDLATARIFQWIDQKDKQYVCVAPVSTLVDCNQRADYRAIVNQAGMVTPDGMPVVWLLKFAGSQEAARTYGPDLTRRICREGVARNLKHFFYGGTEESLKILKAVLETQAPGINIVGMYAPEFMPQAKELDRDVRERIQTSGADILWVGLGSPKQDYWMSLNRPVLNVPVIIGVGAAFDFIAGIKPQAPKWMQSIGLEWFFRLCCEPKRLARRYLIGNALFIYFVIRRLITNAGRI